MTVAAGLLAFRFSAQQRSSLSGLELLVAHPGGPYWAKKDDGAWTIPKGLCEPDEDRHQAAVREFAEETGYAPPEDLTYLSLGEVKMKSSSKRVHAWAFELPDGADFDPEKATSNTFEIEWPPRSGQIQAFPEIDRVGWFHWTIAEKKLLEAQRPFVQRLCAQLQSGDVNDS